MERRTISQLARGALEELEAQCYARVSITHYRQAFGRIERYFAKIGEAFISDGWEKRTTDVLQKSLRSVSIRMLQSLTSDETVADRSSDV